MADVSAAGIMDPAFFVGKAVLLRWVNEFFQVNYTKVEQAATGALYCQIVDAVFPGKVQLHKVNFNARHEHEYVQNFKVLQAVFNSEGITKGVPVDKLIKAKYQDNLEFLQWMKRFFDVKYGGQPYNAKQRREECSKMAGGKKFPAKPTVAPTSTPTSAPSSVPKVPAKKPTKSTPTVPMARGTRKPLDKKTSMTSPTILDGSKKPGGTAPTRPTTTSTKPKSTASAEPAPSLEVESERERMIAEKARATVDGLEKERNFYFDKLREIEILCQSDEEHESALKQEILKILYATDDNEEFQSPDTGETVTNSGSGSSSSQSVAGPTSSSDRTLVEENVDDLLADLGETQSQSGHTVHSF